MKYAIILLIGFVLQIGSSFALPAEGSLVTNVEAPIIAQGKQIGSMLLPAGAKVMILSIQGDGILVNRGEGTPFKLPREVLTSPALPAIATPTPWQKIAEHEAHQLIDLIKPGNSSQATDRPLSDQEKEAITKKLNAAIERVKAIVNQPVTPLLRTPGMSISMYGPGWFHEGAITPDFNNVDVRKTQELTYSKGNEYSSSDLNPGMAFLSRDLEFNSMTKYFYVDRSVPKKRLTEAEMLEINALYRTIGECNQQLSIASGTPSEPPSPLVKISAFFSANKVVLLIAAAVLIAILLLLRKGK